MFDQDMERSAPLSFYFIFEIYLVIAKFAESPMRDATQNEPWEPCKFTQGRRGEESEATSGHTR